MNYKERLAAMRATRRRRHVAVIIFFIVEMACSTLGVYAAVLDRWDIATFATAWAIYMHLMRMGRR